MTSLAPILAEHPFFAGLPAAHIETIAGCAKNVRYLSGEVLFREGDDADKLWVVRQGRVAVETHAPQTGPIVIATVAEPEILGWSWLLPPYRWRFQGRAVELTRALELDATCLRNKCEADHDLGYEVLKRFADLIAQRLDAARLQLVDLYADVPAAR
jgi:CRP-like cAMP-binding protein